MGDLGVADGVIERILAHSAQGVTRRHYNHSAKLAEQRAALDLWAGELERLTGLAPMKPGPDHARLMADARASLAGLDLAALAREAERLLRPANTP
jgi:hypothetical protein